MSTNIEWTDETWNPVTGCTRVSAGCDNCYAVRMTKRLAGQFEKYQGLINPGKDHFNGVVKLHPDRLEDPLRWRKPRRIFVNSMSDLFHEKVPFEFIDKVFAVMGVAERHQFQVLTKRPGRAAEYFEGAEDRIHEALFANMSAWPLTRQERWDINRRAAAWVSAFGVGRWPFPNVWIGTSVENQETADERIPHLLRIPAAVRWLSMEPLLGPVDLSGYLTRPRFGDVDENGLRPYEIVGRNDLIHWIVVGGESGPGARPMHPDWARSIRDQCVEAGVPLFVKQMGSVWASRNKATNSKGGAIEEFPPYLQIRQHPFEEVHA